MGRVTTPSAKRKRRKLYLGKTSDPEGALAAKRTESSGE